VRGGNLALPVTTLALNRILLWVLMDLERREASACVVCTAGKAKRLMQVQRGQLISAESNLKHERIGDMLVSEGLLDPVLLEPVAAEAARRKTLLGAQLVTDGLLSAADLQSALDRQVTFRLGGALSMRGLVTIEPARPATSALDVPMLVAVATAFRSWVPLAAIEADLMASAEDDEEPMVLDDSTLAFSMLELGPAELRLAKKLAKGERLEDLLSSGAPREPVIRLVGALRAVGLWR
jgi:hypothetical protein